jgi:hypothetical protein
MFRQYENSIRNKTEDLSDVGKKVFDEWYTYAKRHAKGGLEGGNAEMIEATKGALKILLRTESNNPFMGVDEEYAQSEFLRHTETIFSLFKKKPKFRTLLTSVLECEGYGRDEDGEGKGFVEWVNVACIPSLERLYSSSHVPNSLVCNALGCTTELLLLGKELALVDADRYRQNPIGTNPKLISHFCADSNVSMLVKDSAIKLAKEAGSDEVRALLVNSATDKGGLLVALEIGALRHERTVLTLLKRVQVEEKMRSRQTRREIEFSDATNTFSLNLLNAIHENAMNMRNEDVGWHYSSKTEDSSAERNNSTLPNEDAVCMILKACDSCQIKSSDLENSASERSHEFLETLSTLMEVYPNSKKLLCLALEPLTIEGIKTVAGWCNNFSEQTWVDVLFPFIQSEMSKMGLEGVSGRPLEQEVVDLLRDCARIMYLNEGGKELPSITFADELFLLVVTAIRHGYIETEGFPRIAAKMMIEHAHDNRKLRGRAGESSGASGKVADKQEQLGGLNDSTTLARWLHAAFDESICHKLKTRRAIHEIVFSLLGLNSTAWGLDSAVLQSKDADDVLHILSSPPHNSASLGFWRELCFSYPGFLEKRETSLRSILEALEEEVNGMIFRRMVTEYHWFDILQTLIAMIPRITAQNAPLLFDVTLKVMALDPPRQGKQAAYDHGSYSDETLALVVEAINPGTPISSYAINEAIRVGGKRTKAALSKLMPWLLLRDRHPLVRASAMRAMAQCDPRLVAQHADDIIFASAPEGTYFSEENDGSEGAAVNAIDIATGSAGVMAVLAIAEPKTIAECMDRLIWCAKITAENDPQLNPSPDVISHLDRILRHSFPEKVLNYLLSKAGLSKIMELQDLSSYWNMYIEQLEREGFIKKQIITGRMKRGRASSAGSKSESSSATSKKGKGSMYEVMPKGEQVLDGSNKVSAAALVPSWPSEGKSADTLGSVPVAEAVERDAKQSGANYATTLPSGAMSTAYAQLHANAMPYAHADPSESWETLLNTRNSAIVWDRQPPVVGFAVEPGTVGLGRNLSSLRDALPAAPTHAIVLHESTEVSDAHVVRRALV